MGEAERLRFADVVDLGGGGEGSLSESELEEEVDAARGVSLTGEVFWPEVA